MELLADRRGLWSDGAAYILDWVSGWGPDPRGHLPNHAKPRTGRREAALVAESRRLLGEGWPLAKTRELLSLLGNPDRRVQLEAQWELAGEGPIP